MAPTSHAHDLSPELIEKAPERPSSIGRYLVLNLVGKGAMGEVYAAYDPELDRKVAIKLLRGKPGNDAEAAEGRQRMMREAQAIAKLSHPNVVVVYDVGAFQDQVFVAMEFVEGHTVWYWMHAQTRAWSDVLKIFADAGRGLAAAHEKGLVHRDFKPENVMVSADGQVRVMDFGLARSVDAAQGPLVAVPLPAPRPADTIKPPERASFSQIGGADDEDIESTRAILAPIGSSPRSEGSPPGGLQVHLTQTGAILGTPAYMAPEQFRGGATDARTDQFSFCVALYEALYGERPFAGNTPQALEASILRGAVREPPPGSEVPGWVRKLLLRGLRPNTDERWPSMKDLLGELDKHRLFARRRRFADGATAKLADIWPAPTRKRPVETAARAEMRAAFLATGKAYAGSTFQKVTEALDRYARKWADMYTDICEATHVRGEQSVEIMDLRMTCLMDLLEGLRALCVIFRQASADVVENAVSAVNALGIIERCADIKFLSAVVKPPDDQTTRVSVERLRSRLAEVRVLCHVGRLDDGLKTIAPIHDEAQRLGYVPLLAETFLELGKLHAERRNGEDGSRAFEEAVWTGELSRHDEVAAEAATNLVFTTGETQGRFDAAEIWSRYAETILRRIGGHDIVWGWLFNNRGAVREKQGRLTEALEDSYRAVAAKEKAGGVHTPDVALSLGNIALYLAQLDQAEQALPHIERATRILNEALGPEHPRTAIMQLNHVEVLNALGRFAQAREICARTVTIFEAEVGFGESTLAYPLTALGLAYLGEGRPQDALPVLERARTIRDAKDPDPARRGEVHFALARALFAVDQDLPRARALAARARDEYSMATRGPTLEKELAKVTAWLAADSAG